MNNIYKALAAFQQSCPIIHKDTQGFGYSYADLPAIYTVIMPLLKEHGLGFTQILQGTGIETIVFHCESGESIKGFAEIPQGVQLAKMNEFQVLGSAVSYFRRYALSSMLGLVTDKDLDAAGEQVAKAAPKAKSATQSEFDKISAQIDLLSPSEAEKGLAKLRTSPNPSLTADEVAKLINKLEILLSIKPF